MGIPNLGSTCFVATCLQCLKSCRVFMTWLRAQTDPLSLRLGAFYEALDNDPRDVNILSNTRELYDAFLGNSRAIDQGDVHECLLTILSALSKSSKTPPKPLAVASDRICRATYDPLAYRAMSFLDGKWKPESSLDALFEGQLAHVQVCASCQNTRLSSDTFGCMSLGNARDVAQGLKEVTSAETLEDIQCDTCLRRTHQKRATRIHRTPEILVLLFDGQKDKHVPSRLDMRPFVWDLRDDRPHIPYRLKAAACHFGTLSSGGHYIALCERDRKWIAFNDMSSVEVSGEADLGVLLRHAYLVVYERL